MSPVDVAEADRLGLRCLYLLIPATNIEAVTAAEDLGFRVVDERVTLSRPLSPVAAPDPIRSPAVNSPIVRPAVVADLATLESLARTAHTDSRFFADRDFDREAAARMYVVWLRNSVAGELADTVLVVEDAGRPIGYITGRVALNRVTAAIGLFAIAESARGRGLGSALLTQFLATPGGSRIAEVTVVTQGGNVAAQRVYQAAGFRTTASELWLHRWASDRHDG